jgi:CRISPR-associated protein Csd1
MLLQRLVEYSNRLNLPPALYNEAPVRYIIELDGNGKLLSPHPTDTADPSSPRSRRGQVRLVPQVQRTVAIKPLLLADKGDYTLGVPAEGKDPARAASAHEAYMELLATCAQTTRESAVEAVLTFLRGAPLQQLQLGADFDPGQLMTFRVDGIFPIDLPAVQAFWAIENDPEARAATEGEQATVMQCLVCGQERPVLARLQAKIKGVPGGQTSGTSIISANADAFESYGLEASLIAPTCASCGERFTKAANELISGQESRLLIGNAVFIFWTREDVGFNIYSFMSDPKPEQVKSLLDSVRSGKEAGEINDKAFYAAALSASGGRTVVRDYIDTTIGQVRRHLASWFRRQELVDPERDVPEPFGLYRLAVATVREGKDLAPPTPRALLHSALAGTPLPMDLLYDAVRRCRAEQGVTRPRAALVKSVLISRGTLQEDTMVDLEQSNSAPAYLCGRLLAVLERAQNRAIPGVKAGIVDRFYGTASSAPASVFGTLMRGLQEHLAKLERDERGTYIALQTELEEILPKLKGFPKTLTLEEQGVFALGYYHQRAEGRTRAREKSEQRKASQLATGETEEDKGE